jgi:HSP20 family molecular chaperone IbpA
MDRPSLYEKTPSYEKMPFLPTERRPIPSTLEQKEWVPLGDRKLVSTPMLDIPEMTKRFPIEPEDYFPKWKQEHTYSPEDEFELIHRVGVKSGIHLQALTRDLNRLASLAEGPTVGTNKRDNVYALADVLDEMDRMDFNIKRLLSNLHNDLLYRSSRLKDLIQQEEDDEAREEEALRKRKSGVILQQQQPIVTPVAPATPLPTQIPAQMPMESPPPVMTKPSEPQLWEEKEIHKTIRHFGRPEEVHLHRKKKPVQEQVEEPTPLTTPTVPLTGPQTPLTTPTTPLTGPQTPLTSTLSVPISDKPFVGKTTGPTTPLERQGGVTETRGEKFHPFFDIQDNPENLTLISFIPGMRKEDIRLDFGPDSFTIEGNALPSGEQETGKYGSFLETYKLPTRVNPNEVRASYHGGQLQIMCPKEMMKESAF